MNDQTDPRMTMIAPFSEVRTSPSIAQLAEALAAAQGEMEMPDKDREVVVRPQNGAQYKFSYATLDNIVHCIRPALAKHGLAVIQPVVTIGGRPHLVTRIMHKSGEWSESLMEIIGDRSKPQAFGSALTYTRRYSLTSMLLIVSEDDDDGAAAAGNEIMERRDYGRRQDPRSRDVAPRREEATEQNAEAVARTLINRARLAEGVEEGHDLLQAWLERANLLEKLRGTQAWEPLEKEIGAGLKRSLGVEPAAAFIAALRATTPDHIATLQQHWEGKWAETLAGMQQEAPVAYALLRNHVAAHVARVRAAQPERPAEQKPAVPGGMVEHVRGQQGEAGPGAEQTVNPQGDAAAEGAPDSLALIAPDGTRYTAKANPARSKTVDQVWLEYFRTALTQVTDTQSIEGWRKMNADNLALVKQHFPNTAKAAADLYADRYRRAEGAGKPQAGK